jgi:hypothetical protein
MSLKHALETAKEILAQSAEQLDETYVEAEMDERSAKAKKKSGGEDKDAAVTADGEGAKSADGTTPKVIEPLETGELGKAEGSKVVVDKPEDSEEEMPVMSDPSEEEMDDEEEEEMMPSEEEGDAVATPGQKEKVSRKIKESLGNLFSGEELSEEFKDKAEVVFEAAINMKVDEIRSELSEEFDAQLEEEKEQLSTKLDEYLSYVVENWMKENQVAIDAGIRSDIAESFMTGLKGLFETHYVSMPQEKYDLVDGLNDKIDDLESKLNESIEKSIELSKGLIKAQCEALYESEAKDMIEADEEKFRKMVENLDFDTVEDFQDKLSTLKENFFNEEETVKTPLVEEFAVSEEDDVKENIDLSPSMSAYTNMLSRINTSAKNNRLN